MSLIAAIKAAWDSWLDAERDRLPIWLPVFMGAGVLAYFSLRFEPPAWAGAAIAAPALSIAIRRQGLRWLFAPLAAILLARDGHDVALCAVSRTDTVGLRRARLGNPKGRR